MPKEDIYIEETAEVSEQCWRDIDIRPGRIGKKGRPKGTKETLCNCREWALLGSYSCPVHGNKNFYRQKSQHNQ